MNSDAVLLVRAVFSTMWAVATGFYIPGTNITPAAFFAFLAFAVIALKFIRRLTGGGDDA